MCVSCSTLAKVAPRSVSYPEQSQAIREALARVLEAEEEWTKAAQVLQGIDLDSGASGVFGLVLVFCTTPYPHSQDLHADSHAVPQPSLSSAPSFTVSPFPHLHTSFMFLHCPPLPPPPSTPPPPRCAHC